MNSRTYEASHCDFSPFSFYFPYPLRTLFLNSTDLIVLFFYDWIRSVLLASPSRYLIRESPDDDLILNAAGKHRVTHEAYLCDDVGCSGHQLTTRVGSSYCILQHLIGMMDALLENAVVYRNILKLWCHYCNFCYNVIYILITRQPDGAPDCNASSFNFFVLINSNQ